VAADSTVRLLVDARSAITGLKRTNQETKKLEGAVRDMNGRLRDSKGRFVAVGSSATTASKGVNTLTRSVKGLLGAFAAIQAAKFVFFKTAELETQTKSLQVLTGSLQTAKGIIGELQAFGRVTPFTSSELIETAKRLKAFGFETNQVVDVTKRLADVAGATGADLGGIATAFGQIQAKGRLQGEELLQLQERGVGLQSKLREMYGLTGEEFSKALQQGRISAEAVNFALIELTEAGGQYANGAIAQSDTLAGKFSTLVDGIEMVAKTIGEVLSPALKNVLDLANSALARINQAMAAGSITPREKQGFKAEAEAEVRRFAGPMPGGPFGAGEIVVRALGQTFRGPASSVVSQITNEMINQEVARRAQTAMPALPAPVGPTTVPALTQGTSARAGGTRGRTTATKIDPIERQREQLQQLLISEQNRLSLAQALNEEERRTVELNIALGDIKRQFPNLSDEELRTVTGLTIQYNDQLRINDERLKQQDAEAKKQKELEDQQKKAAERLAQTYQTIGDAIKTGVVDSLTAAVEGTKSLAEVASNTLRSLANTLLKLGINAAFGALGQQGGIFGQLFGGQRANGGTVSGGRSYLVGERGPELFTPGRTGSIAPNSAMGGNSSIVVNVDATGSAVQGDAGEAKQLGDAIGVAIRQELLKQKRPGGLLA
jgi:tape measure domain-containing protein